MKTIFTVLQDIEKLIYKILMWAILIPKTLVYVVLDPLDAPTYVREELQEDKDSPFDEYISPVILLLVVALLPALAFNFLPKYEVTISSPAVEKTTTDRFLLFESQADFKSAATDMTYIHTWIVEQVQPDGSYQQIYQEVHAQDDGYFEVVDQNTVKDRFLYAFDGSGNYYVNVIVDKVNIPWEQFQATPNINWNNLPIVETLYSYIDVSVPVRLDEPIVVSSSIAKGTAETDKGQDVGNFSDRIKQEQTIFLALGLMLPPLLFAFATKIFKKKDPKDTEAEDKSSYTPASEEIMGQSPFVSIGEETLKNSFYVQCYYFSPLSLAIWGTYYASYFYTEDIFLYRSYTSTLQIILLPLVLAVMWFLRTEVKYFVLERKTTVLRATLISVACITLLGAGGYVLYSFNSLQDFFRLWGIRIFPIAAILFVLAFFYAWSKRRINQGEKIVGWNGAGLVIVVLLFFGIMKLIPYAVEIATTTSGVTGSQPESQSASQPTLVADISATEIPQATATPVLEFTPTPILDITPTPVVLLQSAPSTAAAVLDTPTSVPQQFYTEEFNGDLAGWFDFMSSGDQRMVDKKVELGKLSLRLLQLEDKLPWYYLINDSFTYSNVKVEAVVTNRGNNANGVGLICRYSDIGWYEFVFSNSGTFDVYAVDSAGVVNQGYNRISTGGSPLIKTGQTSNVYSITCEGNNLSLLVNQKLVRTITDNRFKFAEGKIGLSFTSPKKLPTKVEIESLTVSEP